MRVLGGDRGLVNVDLKDIVILDVLDDLTLPHGRCPESFVSISILELCQEGRSFMWVLGGC